MASINWVGVLVAAIVYFFFGALWFMALFGKAWAKYAGLNMENPPSSGAMVGMMVKSFLGDLLSAIAVGLVIVYAHASGDWMRGLKIGAVIGFGIAGGAYWMTYNWTKKPFMLWVLDTAHVTIGCAIAGGIIAAMS